MIETMELKKSQNQMLEDLFSQSLGLKERGIT